MEENCLASEAYRLRDEGRHDYPLETRRLLRRVFCIHQLKSVCNAYSILIRFTSSISNVGNADFRPFIPKSQWIWHGCHQHYHSMEVKESLRDLKIIPGSNRTGVRALRHLGLVHRRQGGGGTQSKASWPPIIGSSSFFQAE